MSPLSLQVRGFSKKGRNFYNISTFMTERIASMFVHGNELHLSGEHLYCHYVDNKEQPYYVSQDHLHDICPVVVPGLSTGQDPVAMLACGDRALRVVVGKATVCEVPLDVCPTSLCPLGGVEGGMLFGTSCGRVGAVTVTAQSHTVLWLGENPIGLGPVTAIAEGALLTAEGAAADVVVGHECGTVEVLSVGADGPEVRAVVRLGSAVTGVAVGNFSSDSSPDVVVATYSGAVVGFSAVAAHAEEVGASVELYAERLAATAAEVASLEDRLKTARAAAATANPSGSDGGGGGTPLPVVDVRDSFALVESDAAHLLTLELAMSIEMVVLHCDIDASIAVAPGTAAAATYSAVPGEGLVGCYACEPGTTRLQIVVRATEGQYGTLEANVIPHHRPKVCCRRRYQICALSLHERVSDPIDETLPLSTVELEGRFSASEFHVWLGRCLSDLAPQVSAARTVLVYTSTMIGTHVEVVYEDNMASLRSDCLSTLAILRDTISKEATLNSVHIKMTSHPTMASVPHCLQLLAPKFEYHLHVVQQYHVLESLKELVAHEGNGDFLMAEQRRLLENAAVIEREHADRPHHLRRLHGMVIRIYTDMCAFQRRNPKAGLERLNSTLQGAFNMADLLRGFDSP
jgi:Bardet-Biedl syndrome 7 protein